jgi:putative ABC transport system permease protein
MGARNRDVLRQFLCEAIVLSMSGGLIGIGLGVFASHAISDLFGWTTRVSAGAIGLSVLFALVIGIFFGYYPATRAATLDPIEALRYE